MTLDQRVDAIARFGFTDRQSRFLVTVLLHAGVCVPRQYAAFAGIAYGHKINVFFDRLVNGGYASPYPCVHNRARLYHVHHHALYRAAGEPHSRYRRPVSAARAVERVMLLDGMFANPRLTWLASELEKVEFFRSTVPALPADRLPHSVGTATERRPRRFPDASPIGVEPSGRVVFQHLMTTSDDGPFRAFLQRHADLLAALPEWTLQLLLPWPVHHVSNNFDGIVRNEIATPFPASTIDELRWYFEQCRAATTAGAGRSSDPRFRRAQYAFANSRARALYRRWLTDGEAVFEVGTSTTIASALACGNGRIECRSLRSYRHLSPLVSVPRSDAEGVEEGAPRGDATAARPQPPAHDPIHDPTGAAEAWYRLVRGRSSDSAPTTCADRDGT